MSQREDRHRDDEPRRAGQPRPRWSPSCSSCSPTARSSSSPSSAGLGRSSPGAATPKVRGLYAQDRRRLADSPLHPRPRARDGRAARPALARDRAARLLRRLPIRHSPRARTRSAPWRADGVERAVAFTQYPQFSCSTTGSSLNELWRAAERTGLRDAFAVEHHRPLAGARRVHRGDGRDGPRGPGAVRAGGAGPGADPLQRPLPAARRDRSRRCRTRRRSAPACRRWWSGWRLPNPYLLAYQSEVGRCDGSGPSTEQVIRRLGARGQKHVLVVPIAFTSDHIETLSELDREYGEVAHRAGITHYRRTPALNDRPQFIDALADIVREHLASGRPYGALYRTRCPGCENPQCRQILSPVTDGACPRPRSRGRRGADRGSPRSDSGGTSSMPPLPFRTIATRELAYSSRRRPAHRVQHPAHQPVRHLLHD